MEIKMKHHFDFSCVTKRISTWLGVASASATAALGAYALMPERAQATFPEWALAALGIVAVGSALLVPIATSFKQPALKK